MPINERDIFWDWDAACNRQDAKSQQELARYVLEDLDEVARIFHNAKSYLKDHAFYAYESDNPPQRAREEVEALYKCLQNGKPKAGGDYLAYVLEDIKSVRVRGKQRVRLAREVLFWGHGVCLDWVLLFAACVFKAHIYPLIIATSAHVILGYWLTEHDAETYGRVILSGAEIREHFSKERIKVINATRIPPNERGEPMSFDQAEDEAETHVPYALFAVDIRAARGAGIESLLPLKPWSGNHSLPPAEHFQERPELEDIHKWWRDENSYGVLALVGIGGVGKTAVVHRFLAQLPGSDIQDEGVGKDETLPIPDALFVWNFYQHPDIDRCATALYTYLTGEQVNKATFEQVQDVLSKNYCGCRVLLVFDGVEKLQIAPGIEPEEEGGTFGQFRPEGAPLGRFLAWCCDTPRPVHVLITSRFGLTELRRYKTAGGYGAVDLGDLPHESARALLQATGVKGLVWQLDELIRRFGKHALSLDLLGNYIFLIHYGDPTHVLSRAIPPLESEEVRVQTETRDTETLSIKLAHVLRFYEELLQRDDPAALGVLQRLCLFHIIPVDEHILAEIFSRAEASIAGPLAGLSSQQIRRHLLNLCGKYRLVQGEPKENPQKFSVHPVVHEYFYMRIDQKIVLHDAVRAHLASLAESPTFNKPTDPATLDVLEELVYHTSRVAQQENALRLYSSRLGGYSHLGQKLGAYSRGEALLRMIIPYNDVLFAQINAPKEAQLLFFHDLGNYLKILGYLDKAAWCFRQQAHVSVANTDYLEGLIAFQDLTYVLLSQGYLHKAALTCEESLKLAGEIHDAAELMHSYADRAQVRALQGEIDEARIDFGAALYYQKIAGAPHEACCVITPDGWLLTSWHNISVSPTGAGGKMLLQYLGKLYEVTVDVQRSAPERGLAVLRAGLDLSKSESFIRGPKSQVGHLIINATEPMLQIPVWTDTLYGIPGIWYGHLLLRLHYLTTAEQAITLNKQVGREHWGHTTALCNILFAELYRMQGKPDKAREVLTEAVDWGVRTADQEVLIWGNLIRARLALDSDDLDEVERAIREGLGTAEYCGYGLYYIDLLIAKGQLALRKGDPNLAEQCAREALDGDQGKKPKLFGARHPECGYAWGEGDALHLLGEALLALAHCVGSHGHDSKGRSYKELLEKARQAAEAALALRKRIQDPKAKDTQDLLSKIKEAQGGDGP
uniref:Tetratricopeptide repeat protein n=1 Tax=Candidatus Methanosuratincola petrocarbonis (ex Vanwonterghem et al. 2016) TaxID=1867261 RepID=A0A7J3UZQ4_9CREN